MKTSVPYLSAKNYTLQNLRKPSELRTDSSLSWDMAVKVVKAYLERIDENSVGFVSLTPVKSSKLSFAVVSSNPLNR